MKSKYYCLFFSSLLSAACITANTQQNNVMPTNINNRTSATASPTPQNFFPPTAEDVNRVLKDSTEKLGVNNAQIMTLSQQPPDVVSSLAPFHGKKYDPSNLKWAENIKVVVGERDLNHDGAAERVIVEFTDIAGSNTTPEVRFFGLKKEKWKCLTCPILIYLNDNAEFVPTGKKGEFDILRFRDEVAHTDYLEDILSANELSKWKDYVTDFRVKRVKNEKYDFYECRVETGKAKKIVPCPK